VIRGKASCYDLTALAEVAMTPMTHTTVLLVDDNRDLLQFLERLMAQPGWNLLTAESAREAQKLARNHKPDAALVDYMLPDGNGVELAQQLRQVVPNILITIMTGSMLAPEEEAICDENDFPVLRKPFLATEVMNQISRRLPSRQARPEEIQHISEFDLDGKRPLNEGKLILVGRGEVGKTSLVRRLVDDEFSDSESQTHGINITNWLFPCGNVPVRLNIWDFGGQEIMHSTHQFFLTQQTLYLLVLSGRGGDEDIDAEYWLKHIESFGAGSPVIVVQNKTVQCAFELNYRGLRARYPQIRYFAKTDCKEQIGLSELKTFIKSVVDGMPEVRMPLPFSWFRVKERLESMRNEYLSYQEFVGLCVREGIDSQAERDQFGFVMHCLGIALHYRDDPRLRETSVLKPEWVTQGIYRLLNAESVADRQGELHLDDLKNILPRMRYPLDKHLFIMELMRKFSLCFPFQDDDGRYLVPELLGKEEPEEVTTFEPGRCLNFGYGYRVLPEGLLPRFVVRTHILSRGRKRWRSGVVLFYENATALVKAEQVERSVLVQIKGGDAGARRRLLAIIRFDLERIHAEFSDRLEAQARVPLVESPAHAIDYKKLVMFERRGIMEFPEFIDGRVLNIQVRELLDGVDFEEQRVESVEDLGRAKSIFMSYSHKDEGLRDELETHLKLLQRQRFISMWYDRKISPGSEWNSEIDYRIEHAAIILLLISADFIASDYCWEKEVRRALERHASKEATVVPVLLRSCDWKTAPFAKLQGLPKDMKAVTAWPDRDAAWADVAAGIRNLIENLTHVGPYNIN